MQIAWMSAKNGHLCAREQAKAWGLREAWRAEGKKDQAGLRLHVAGFLQKSKGGKPRGGSPSAQAVGQLFQRMDDDPDWFPGKGYAEATPGPKRLLRGPKATAIAAAAKRLKTGGEEPTYSSIVAACPTATLNPSTGQPVDKHLVYRVFRETCYDEDPVDTWQNMARLSRSALDPVSQSRRFQGVSKRVGLIVSLPQHVFRTRCDMLTCYGRSCGPDSNCSEDMSGYACTADWGETVLAQRFAFAEHMRANKRADSWYYNNVAWCDLCNSILPKTQKKAKELALARKAGKAWMSKGSKGKSANLRMPKAVQKLNSSDTQRVWWVPILAKGKFHIEALPDDFPGETPGGAVVMVGRVKAALNVRFQGARAPKVVFTDRGNGFFGAGNGKITKEYKKALAAAHLKSFFGDDASIQPGNLQEIMLHETAVAWTRDRLAKTLPRRPWEETPDAYRGRLKLVAAHINDHYDVDSLCRELPARVHDLWLKKGDRITK